MTSTGRSTPRLALTHSTTDDDASSGSHGETWSDRSHEGSEVCGRWMEGNPGGGCAGRRWFAALLGCGDCSWGSFRFPPSTCAPPTTWGYEICWRSWLPPSASETHTWKCVKSSWQRMYPGGSRTCGNISSPMLGLLIRVWQSDCPRTGWVKNGVRLKWEHNLILNELQILGMYGWAVWMGANEAQSKV